MNLRNLSKITDSHITDSKIDGDSISDILSDRFKAKEWNETINIKEWNEGGLSILIANAIGGHNISVRYNPDGSLGNKSTTLKSKEVMGLAPENYEESSVIEFIQSSIDTLFGDIDFDEEYSEYTENGVIDDPENFDEYVQASKEMLSKFKAIGNRGDYSYGTEIDRNGNLHLDGYGDAMSGYDFILTRKGTVLVNGEKFMGDYLGGVNGTRSPSNIDDFIDALQSYYDETMEYID